MPSTSGSTTSEIMDNSITTIDDRKEVDDAAVQQAVEEVAAVAHQQDVIRIAHAMSHDISHGEPVSLLYSTIIFLMNFVTSGETFQLVLK